MGHPQPLWASYSLPFSVVSPVFFAFLSVVRPVYLRTDTGICSAVKAGLNVNDFYTIDNDKAKSF